MCEWVLDWVCELVCESVYARDTVDLVGEHQNASLRLQLVVEFGDLKWDDKRSEGYWCSFSLIVLVCVVVDRCD